MKTKLGKYFMLLAVASMFALAFASCSKDWMDQGGGGGGGVPEATKGIIKPDTVFVIE